MAFPVKVAEYSSRLVSTRCSHTGSYADTATYMDLLRLHYSGSQRPCSSFFFLSLSRTLPDARRNTNHCSPVTVGSMSPYWQRSSENHLPHAYSYARKNIGDDGATGFPVQGSRQNEASDESSIQERSNTSARGPVQDHFVGRRKREC